MRIRDHPELGVGTGTPVLLPPGELVTPPAALAGVRDLLVPDHLDIHGIFDIAASIMASQ